MNSTIDYLQSYERVGKIYLTPTHQRTLSLVLGAIGLHPSFLIKERNRENDPICVEAGAIQHQKRPVMVCDGFVRLRSENSGFDVAVEIKTRSSTNGTAHDILGAYLSQQTRLYRHFDAVKPLAPMWMLVVLMDPDLHQTNQDWECRAGTAADIDAHLRSRRAVVGIGTSDGGSANVWLSDGTLREIEHQLGGEATSEMLKRVQGLEFGCMAQSLQNRRVQPATPHISRRIQAQEKSDQLQLFSDDVEGWGDDHGLLPCDFDRFPRLINCLQPIATLLRSHEERVVRRARELLDDASRDIFDALLRVAASDLALSYQGSHLDGHERNDVLFRSVFNVLRRKIRRSRGRTPWPIGAVYMHFPALLAVVFLRHVRNGEYAYYAEKDMTLSTVMSELRMPKVGPMSPYNPYYILLNIKLKSMLGVRNAIDAVEGL